MFARVEVWAAGLVALAGVLALVAVSAMTRVAATGDRRFGVAGDLSLRISRIPEDTAHAFRILWHGDAADLDVGEDRFGREAGFTYHYPPGTRPDAGYLLLSRYDGDRARSTVELVDLDRQQLVHRWHPDFAAINARSRLTSRFTNISRDNAPNRARALHPLLTDEGELVFQNTSPLVKLDACGEIRWTIDRLFHHSVEAHGDGGYLVPTLIEPSTLTGVGALFKEDGFAHVSPEGMILWEKSLPKVLMENGLGHLVYGLDFYSDDPLHLNDVQYIEIDGPYFRRGDLLLSLRNASAIVLYRPSTNAVVWMKQGPWVNQHDVDVLDDHRIAVFNNNRYSYIDRSVVHGANEVMIHDFSTGQTSSPYASALRELDVRTPFEGLSEILPGGDVIVEETEGGRIFQVSPDGEVRWQFVNRAADQRIYLLNWSRPIEPDDGAAIAARLAAAHCGP